MKLWFEHCLNYTLDGDTPIQLGIDWHRHKNSNPKFKSWFGFSVVVHFFKWSLTMNFVNDYDAYDRKINYWKYRKKK